MESEVTIILLSLVFSTHNKDIPYFKSKIIVVTVFFQADESPLPPSKLKTLFVQDYYQVYLSLQVH